MKTHLALGLAIVLVSTNAKAEAVTADDVLEMAARIPHEAAADMSRPAGFEKSSDALAIAAAVARVATSREEAATLIVYAAYESGLRIKAHGDGGKSRGPWQLKYVSDAVAFSPVAAAKYWLWLAGESARICKANVEDERLASLASGYCDRGRAKVRHRAEVVRLVAGATDLD